MEIFFLFRGSSTLPSNKLTWWCFDIFYNIFLLSRSLIFKLHKHRSELWEEEGFLAVFLISFLSRLPCSAPAVSHIHFQKSRNTLTILCFGPISNSWLYPNLYLIDKSIFTLHAFSFNKGGKRSRPTFYLFSINSSN